MGRDASRLVNSEVERRGNCPVMAFIFPIKIRSKRMRQQKKEKEGLNWRFKERGRGLRH